MLVLARFPVSSVAPESPLRQPAARASGSASSVVPSCVVSHTVSGQSRCLICQKVEKGHFWPDSVSRRGHCQLVRLMMGAMRCLVVAPPVHAPWGSARAVTSHACRRRPTECRSVAGDSSCGAPAGLHEAAGGASSRGLSTLACASARGRAMRGCQDASVGSRWRLKCPCPAVSPSLRCLI